MSVCSSIDGLVLLRITQFISLVIHCLEYLFLSNQEKLSQKKYTTINEAYWFDWLKMIIGIPFRSYRASFLFLSNIVYRAAKCSSYYCYSIHVIVNVGNGKHIAHHV